MIRTVALRRRECGEIGEWPAHVPPLLRRIYAARGATRLLIAALGANEKGRAFWMREGFVPDQIFPDRDYGNRRHDVHRMVKPL